MRMAANSKNTKHNASKTINAISPVSIYVKKTSMPTNAIVTGKPKTPIVAIKNKSAVRLSWLLQA